MISILKEQLPDPHYKGEKLPQEANIVYYAHSENKYHYPRHKTPYLFITNFQNQGCYRLNQKPVRISDRHFYLLNPNDELEIQFNRPVPLQTLLVLFNETFIKQALQYLITPDKEMLELPEALPNSNFYIPDVPFQLTPVIRQQLQLIVQAYSANSDKENALFSLISEIALLHKDTARLIQNIPAVKKSTRKELYKRLFLSRQLIHDSYTQDLSLDLIAREVCLDKFHLIKCFKSLYGITPHRYLTDLRLQKAYSLLKQKQCNVSTACQLVGFESHASFSLLFKRKYGFSPSFLLK